MADTSSATEFTIDELARHAGVTTRNVRAYQERGLLPPPRKVGRTGYYDDEHLERLRSISRLLAEGFSLAAIRSLLDAWAAGGSLADVLGFEQALTAPYTDRRPEVTTFAALGERLLGEADDGSYALALAVEAGVLQHGDDPEQVVVLNPDILALGEILHEVGVPVDAMAEELARLRADADAVALRFLELFLEHVWRPFEAAGAPAADLGRITEALERTRPVPGAAAATMVAQAMRRRMDEVAEQLLATARHDER